MFEKIKNYLGVDREVKVISLAVVMLLLLGAIFGYLIGKPAGAKQNQANVQNALKNSISAVLTCLSTKQLKETNSGADYVKSEDITGCFNQVFIK